MSGQPLPVAYEQPASMTFIHACLTSCRNAARQHLICSACRKWVPLYWCAGRPTLDWHVISGVCVCVCVYGLIFAWKAWLMRTEVIWFCVCVCVCVMSISSSASQRCWIESISRVQLKLIKFARYCRFRGWLEAPSNYLTVATTSVKSRFFCSVMPPFSKLKKVQLHHGKKKNSCTVHCSEDRVTLVICIISET